MSATTILFARQGGSGVHSVVIPDLTAARIITEALTSSGYAVNLRGTKSNEPEWEYRTLLSGGDPQPHSGLNSGRVSLAEWFSLGDERIASGLLTLERRRVAGPWEQVEKGVE